MSNGNKQQTKRQKQQKAKVIVPLVIGLGAYITTGIFLHHKMLKRTHSKSNKEYEFSNMAVKSVTLKTVKQCKKKMTLHAYKIEQPQRTNKWAVVVHGYRRSAKRLAKEAEVFYNKGYNVLVPDLRGHGLSEGDYISMGWYDRLDLIDWVNQEILASNREAEIVLYGVSMGASTVMMASGEEQFPLQIKVLIADCGFTSVPAIFAYQMGQNLQLHKTFIPPTDWINRLRTGFAFEEASAMRQLKRNKTPILFIHGDQDTTVPLSMQYELYRATSAPKDAIIIEGAGHAECSMTGEAYWSAIFDFIQQYLKDE